MYTPELWRYMPLCSNWLAAIIVLWCRSGKALHSRTKNRATSEQFLYFALNWVREKGWHHPHHESPFVLWRLKPCFMRPPPESQAHSSLCGQAKSARPPQQTVEFSQWHAALPSKHAPYRSQLLLVRCFLVCLFFMFRCHHEVWNMPCPRFTFSHLSWSYNQKHKWHVCWAMSLKKNHGNSTAI